MPKVKKIQMPSGTTLDLPDGFDWIGTKEQYDTAWSTGAIKSNWICMITDDGAENPSKANVALDNLSTAGEARFNAKADTNLGNITADAHKLMDGQWVAKSQVLSSDTAAGTYTIDLGPNGINYLPNDNYNYEVIVNVEFYKANATVTRYLIYSDLCSIQTNQLIYTASGQRRNCNITMPIANNKKIYVKILDSNCDSQLTEVLAYRRIGVNS